MTQPDSYNWGSSNTADTDYFRTVLSPMSAALLSNGYAGADIPDNQDHNTLFRNSYLWQQHLLSRTKSDEPTLLRSTGTATWNGSTLTLAANLDFSFRKDTGEQINRIASGALAFSDGQVLVLRRDEASASPVVLALAASYGALALGQYVIVAESSLTATDREYQTVIFRCKGTTIEFVQEGLVFTSGATISFGNHVDNAANYSWAGTHSFLADTSIAATKKFYRDGGGDTYDTESAANVWDFYAGGAKGLSIDQTQLGVFIGSTYSLIVAATKAFYHDGGGDTYDVESSANVLDKYVGGTLAHRINSAGETLMPDVDPPTANYMNRNSGAKAWLHYIDATSDLSNSYNVDSVTDEVLAGQYTIIWDTDFSTARYAMAGMGGYGTNVSHQQASTTTAQTKINLIFVDGSADADADFLIMAIGDQ